jgi:hypothetical protein
LSVEKQRLLEQALLLSGQFKDALKGLMDWLNKMANAMDDKGPVHGDLDTVMSLDEKHKGFIAELEGRTEQVDTIKQTAEDLLKTADKEDSVKIKAQVTELTSAWDKVWSLTNNRSSRLKDALKEAEELHKSVNMLLEWLSDAEMKLRFSGPLPEDEEEVQRQIDEHEKFMAELKEKEKDKDYTLKLAHDILDKCHPDAVSVIKHWITIIQSRWDEVASWALQRYEKLQDHLKQLKDLLALLDELMQWLIGKENTLVELEAEPLPDDLAVIETLIEDHQGFMDNLSSRQPEIDAVCKPMRPKSQAPNSRKASRISKAGRDSRDGSPDNEPTPGSRRQRYGTPLLFPLFFFNSNLFSIWIFKYFFSLRYPFLSCIIVAFWTLFQMVSNQCSYLMMNMKLLFCLTYHLQLKTGMHRISQLKIGLHRILQLKTGTGKTE